MSSVAEPERTGAQANGGRGSSQPAGVGLTSRLAGRAVSLAGVARWTLAAFAALVCVMMLWWPLGFDQGVFASSGAAVLRGGAPYRDSWDLKGPLAFYMMAGIQLLFGAHAWGIRAVDVALALIAAWILRRQLRPVTSAAVAFTAAASWPIFVAALTYDDSAQFDLWVGVAVLASTMLTTRAEGYRTRDLVASGVLVGLSSLVKPFFPVFLAVPGIVVLLRQRGATRAAARDVAVLTAAWAAPIAAMLGVLWWQGALRAALDVHILYNVQVYATASTFSMYPSDSALALRVRGLLAFLYFTKTVVLVAPAAAGFVALWRRHRVLAIAVATWLVTGVALVLLQNKFWNYHWEIIQPALAILVFVGLHAIIEDARRATTPTSAVLAVVMSAMLVGVFCQRPAIDAARWLQYVTGRRSADAYYHTFLAYGMIDPAEQRAVAAHIRSHTRPGEPFAHWSLDAVLSFLADRPNVSRFHNKTELVKTQAHPITQGYRREYLDRVRSVRPTYITVGLRGDSLDPASSREVLEREFPELATLVAERYAVEATYGKTDVYRLRAETTPGSATAPTAGAARP
jgi:hypothetical protein